jgi:hypothetical protein
VLGAAKARGSALSSGQVRDEHLRRRRPCRAGARVVRHGPEARGATAAAGEDEQEEQQDEPTHPPRLAVVPSIQTS